MIKLQKLCWLHSLAVSKMSPLLMLSPFFYSYFNSNRCLLPATLLEFEPPNVQRRCWSRRSIYLDRETVFYVPFYCLQSCSKLLLSQQVKKQVTTEQLLTHSADSSSGPERSFVIIAPVNRFMVAIHWHMSGGLSAIMRFWPDKRSYKLIKGCKQSVQAYFCSRHGRTGLDVYATKPGVSFGKFPIGTRPIQKLLLKSFKAPGVRPDVAFDSDLGKRTRSMLSWLAALLGCRCDGADMLLRFSLQEPFCFQNAS